jgi:hypothetical protein
VHTPDQPVRADETGAVLWAVDLLIARNHLVDQRRVPRRGDRRRG